MRLTTHDTDKASLTLVAAPACTLLVSRRAQKWNLTLTCEVTFASLAAAIGVQRQLPLPPACYEPRRAQLAARLRWAAD